MRDEPHSMLERDHDTVRGITIRLFLSVGALNRMTGEVNYVPKTPRGERVGGNAFSSPFSKGGPRGISEARYGPLDHWHSLTGLR